MNETRLKNVYFYIKSHAEQFDMATMNNDFGYYAACVATGDDLNGRRIIEYRGQEMHVHDVGALFLQATEKEYDELFYLGQWPDAAWRLYRKGDRLRALLFAVNRYITS